MPRSLKVPVVLVLVLILSSNVTLAGRGFFRHRCCSHRRPVCCPAPVHPVCMPVCCADGASASVQSADEPREAITPQMHATEKPSTDPMLDDLPLPESTDALTDEPAAEPTFDEPTVDEPTVDAADEGLAEPTTPDAVDDDLFDDDDSEATASEPEDADDLFGEEPEMEATEPAVEPTADEPTADEPAADESADDDLFSDSADADDEMPMDGEDMPAPEDAEAAPDFEDDSLDDLFNLRLPERPSAPVIGLDSRQLRRWVDNTGTFSCQGRLVQIQVGKVRILKSNGHTTTVSFSRLSRNDVNFVHAQAALLTGAVPIRMAQF